MWAAVATMSAVACAGGTTDAGNTTAQSGGVPDHPAPVTGPAVTGSATGGEGSTVAGATVLVAVRLSNTEKNARNTKSAFTFGLGCLDQVGCTTPTSRGRVAGDGHFAVAVPKGGDPADGLVVTLVADRGSDGRVGTSVTLPASARAGTDVGPVPLAGAVGQVVKSGAKDRFVMPPLAGASGSPGVTLSRARAVGSDQQFVVQDPVMDVSDGYDPRLVEDGQVLLVGTQDATVGGRPGGYSASLVTSAQLVPPSRGASCHAEGSTGQRLDQNPCGLTNGMLDTNWQPRDDPACGQGPCPGTAQHDHRDVTVVLKAPVRSDLVVVRGCGFTCQVAVSADGTSFGSWRAAPQDSGAEVAFVLSIPAQKVAAVRVQTSTGGFFLSLRQVSVWPSP